jgi:hypothetical protein
MEQQFELSVLGKSGSLPNCWTNLNGPYLRREGKRRRQKMLLPFRPKPKEDELLSSWLVRLARGYGMCIDDFLSSTDIGTYIRSFDCDRIRSDGLVNLLHDCTGTDRNAIERTLLNDHIHPLFSDGVQSPSANWAWLIPLGRSGRKLAPIGYQVCRYCLSTGEPYYRWQWRMALFLAHCCVLTTSSHSHQFLKSHHSCEIPEEDATGLPGNTRT